MMDDNLPNPIYILKRQSQAETESEREAWQEFIDWDKHRGSGRRAIYENASQMRLRELG